MGLDYTWEKFYEALRALVGEGTLKNRLYYAYTGALMRLEQEDLPADLQERFVVLQELLNKVEPIGNEGSAMASITAMTDQEVEKLAEEILSMYDQICRQDEQEDILNDIASQ